MHLLIIPIHFNDNSEACAFGIKIGLSFQTNIIRTHLRLRRFGSDYIGLVREAGLEPARPKWTLEPESSESANSTTRAHRQSFRKKTGAADGT